MLKEEFEKRVNFSVMPKEYANIEKKYLDGFYGKNLDKDEFCKQWLNAGGIKEVLQSRINGEIELPPIKRYKSDELFMMMINNLKKSGEFEKVEKIYDYYLPSEKEPSLSGESVKLTDYRFDFNVIANFGGSEGIYLDCFLRGKFDDSGKEYLSIGTVKTLKTDLESMKIMAEFGGILNYYTTEFINKNIESFSPDRERISWEKQRAERELKKLGDNLTIKQTPTPLHERSDTIEIENHTGTWYVVDSLDDNGKKLFLLEHEEYGDEAACIIIDENRNTILTDVWNGFNDYYDSEEYLLQFQSINFEVAAEMYEKGYKIHDGYDNPVKNKTELENADPLALKAHKNDIANYFKESKLSVEPKEKEYEQKLTVGNEYKLNANDNNSYIKNKIDIQAKVIPVETESNLKGISTIIINGNFAINGIKIIEGENGLYVKMPSLKNKNEEYEDIAFPITVEAKEQIVNTILKSYHNSTQEKQTYKQPI